MKRACFCAYFIIFCAFFLAFAFPPLTPSALFTNFEPADLETLESTQDGLMEQRIPSPSKITVDIDGQAVEFELEDFLIGVVAAEMPAQYPDEALKAQAVAARSYILYRETLPSSVHPMAQICTDPAHCLAWLSDEQMRQRWQDGYEDYLKKISSAAAQTAGEYMSYEQKPINAVFHAISSGSTESAEDIWSADIPYLAAVASAGEEGASSYLSSVDISAAELRKKLSERYPEAVLPEDITKSFESITRSDSGGVTSVSIGNLRLHGNEIRALAGLRSTNFTVKASDGILTFEVRGYGHGVGMSQHGAKVMAENGADYREILAHYYTGVEFEK